MSGGKGGGKTSLASKPNVLNALRVQTSSYGQVMPIVYGQSRVSGRLLWSGDFVAIPHTSTQKVGGKGLGGGGTISSTTYTYQSAVAAALCSGPIQNIYNVWDTKGRLTLLTTTVQYTVPPGGGSFLPPPDGRIFHSGFGASRQDAYSLIANDYGSDGTVTLSGFQQTLMTLVGSSPGAGQYTLDPVTGQHTFSSADANKVMSITYVYSVPDSNSNGQPQQKLNLTLFPGNRPQSPWSYLTSKHPGQDLGYSGVAYVASSAMDLGESGTLPNLSFEVLGFLPFGGGITDAEPSAIINDLITNPYYGVSRTLPLGNLTQYRNFCTANGLFLSPVLDAQKTAAAWVQEILDVTNSAAVWSEGVLKIVPYGDTTAIGNGATFFPNTSPVYDLSSNDLLTPVMVKRPSIADVMNSVSVEFLNRANDYNVEIAEDKDDAMIAVYGLRKASPQQAHSITTTTVAKQAANFLRKRQVEIRATYTLTLGWQFNLLEPMDLVTLTIPELGYSKKPVRITAIRENDDGQLEMDAEDFPFGTASSTLYPQQEPGGFVPQANADPGTVNTPIIFEAPSLMSRSGRHEIWMAVSGSLQGNLLLYSEQLDNPAWTTLNATVTANAATDPIGGATADAVAFSVAGSSGFIGQLVTPAFQVASQTFTFSCWVKTPSGTNTASLLIQDQTGGTIVSTPFPITSAWQRFSVTGTMGPSATALRVFVYNLTTAGTLHLWGAQLENSSSLNSYTQTVSGPVNIANPNWGGCHVWVSQDNSDYHQIGQIYGPSRMGLITGTAASRTNFLLNSSGFNGTGWTLDGRATLTQNNAPGPDGVANSASTLSRSTAACTHISDLQQTISANAAATPWTFSIWARVISGTQTIQLALDDVTTTLIASPSFTATTSWQRFSFSCVAGALLNTGSMLAGITILPAGSSGSSASVQVFGAQLEKTSGMTPYIPTTSSAVTVTALVNSSADPDPTNYFPVDLTESAATLQSGTQADADVYRTLCYAGGEFISFQGSNLTGSNKYNVGQDGAGNVYLRRGLFGSNVTTHAAGEAFARLDDAIFTYVYDPSFIGKTLYLKFTSFNTGGLMEQSITKAVPYQFVVTGRYCQMESVSKNLLANPGFEYNTASTPVSTYPNIVPITSGQRFTDNWTSWNGAAIAGSGDPYLTVNLETSTPHSGGRSVLVINKPGAVLPNDSVFYAQGTLSDKVAIRPGEKYCFGGYIRLVVDGSLPTGVNWLGAIRAILYDAAGAVLGQILWNGAQSGVGLGNGNPDPTFGGGTGSGSTFSGGYYLQSTYFTVPASMGTAAGKPAFAAVFCTGLLQNTGSSPWSMTGLQVDARFDDCFLFPQWNLTGDEVGKQGSISNTYTGALSYTSNTSSITWSWNFNANRTDTAMTINSYSGSQTVTGLSAGTTYNFYPFIDEINQVVSMVATGGVGTPSWAHNGTSVAWTQEQSRGDHFPLSTAPMAAATTTSGTGGGGGGGVGGGCLRHDALVHARNRGVIPVNELEVGDWVCCPEDEDTPEGWVEVIAVDKSHIGHEWVHTTFNVDDWLATTPGHPFTLEDGSMKRAAQLTLEDAVPWLRGVAYPVNHALEIYSAMKVSVTVRSLRHVFYAGMKLPCLLQHNILAQS
ncbi:MAG TPA: phage tail protein [Candidatus Angelobacter sp.]|nr:phage tail protein [Candidatus Angelobacter sp.]